MIFKGIEIGVGDLIGFTTTVLPIPRSAEITAAVIEVKEETIEVMSTQLVLFGYGGIFEKEEIDNIRIIKRAEESIPEQSGSFAKFKKGDLVSAIVDGKKLQGRVIAAYDGIIVALQDNGECLTSGAYFLTVESE